MSEFSPFWAETRNMELATTKSWIKAWGHCLSFHPAHLPAVRAVTEVSAASKMGSKMAEKRKPAVVIPQRLRPQEKTRSQPEERRPL